MPAAPSIRALLRDPARNAWQRFDGLRDVLSCQEAARAPDLLAQVERRARREHLYAVGFVSYEAAAGFDAKLVTHAPGTTPCAWFALFEDVCDTGRWEPADQPGLDWRPSLDAAAHAAAVRRIQAYIGAGDAYQVNFSYRLSAAVSTAVDDVAWALFRQMSGGQPDGLGAFIECDGWAVCSASPELFFERRGRRVWSRPMKGTAGRGATPDRDAAQARWLQGSLKNRAENLMITDMVRNDIGRIARTGTVHTTELFRLEAYPTVWQLTSTVAGDSDVGVAELFRALFPAASITGAPKRRTMEIIRELEDRPRGIYTGAVGVIHPNGDCRFNVAIRTAWIDKRRGTAEYGVGGGILWDSNAAEELAETVDKARILGDVDSSFALLETLLWEPGTGFLLLEAHLERLAAAAAYFRRPWRPDSIRQALSDAIAHGVTSPQRLRLLVDVRGIPSVTLHPLDPTPHPYRVAVASAPLPVLNNPWVRHKTTQRLLYEQARADASARHPGIHDVLLVNERGELTESTIANLVLDLDGTLVTPAAHCGLLPGVYRRHLLESREITESILRPADLESARAVYLVNALRRCWPVTMVTG